LSHAGGKIEKQMNTPTLRTSSTRRWRWSRWPTLLAGVLASVAAMAIPGGASAATAVPAIAASPAAVPNVVSGGIYVIHPFNNLCLDVPGDSRVDGVQVQQWSCIRPYPGNQKWLMTQVGVGQGVYEIRSWASLKCLDVQNGSASDLTPVEMWGCNSHNNQRWIPIPAANKPAFFNLVALHASKCLDVEFGSNAPGGKLIQYTCDTVNFPGNQVFSFERVG
jgi:hypothetical protein